MFLEILPWDSQSNSKKKIFEYLSREQASKELLSLQEDLGEMEWATSTSYSV